MTKYDEKHSNKMDHSQFLLNIGSQMILYIVVTILTFSISYLGI